MIGKLSLSSADSALSTVLYALSRPMGPVPSERMPPIWPRLRLRFEGELTISLWVVGRRDGQTASASGQLLVGVLGQGPGAED